ncbi:fatty acid-binding protein homolog 6-like [Amphiura filiformis]|uniref:fatty acid-binding protein homolog 6-like n=1 Tax=Amphiura filiformis TaxID=82378 RepID=UPI003B215510
MASELKGRWELHHSDNFDNFLKACGLGFVYRKIALGVKPSVHITQDGDCFEIVTTTSYRTNEWKFSIGEEFSNYVPWDSDKTHRMIAEVEDGKLIIKVLDSSDEEGSPVFIREVVGDELVLTQRLGNVETKRYFTKVQP